MSILPSAKEKRFMKAVMDFHLSYGVGYLYGDEWHREPIQCHHVAGRTYKNNKVHIGHYFILPVPFVLHDVSSNNHLNVTHWRNSFTATFGMQRDLWLSMVSRMHSKGAIDEFPALQIMESISASKY
tara:strand:- start:1001 stop:1381 length:381 start_codon:yes stop_codon:yes gene_type:complete